MNVRRGLITGAGAALLAPPTPSEARVGQEDQFVMGLVANPTLGGPESDLVFNVYASVTGDGTGLGLLTDPLHPEVQSDLRLHARERRGNQYRWEGEVVGSNDPRLVGQPFVLSATVHGEAASPLELALMGETFSGTGLVVIAIIATILALLLPPRW
jgi:hypothetical protein